MGRYKALLSLPKHPFNSVQELDDNDPLVVERVKAGMLTLVVPPGATRDVWADKPAVETEPEPEVELSAKKRPTRKKVETEPATPEDESAGQPDVIAVEAPSSVMTSWDLSD